METLTAKQAELLRDVLNDYLDRMGDTDSALLNALSHHEGNVIELFEEAYETLNAIATGGR